MAAHHIGLYWRISVLAKVAYETKKSQQSLCPAISHPHNEKQKHL